MDVSDEMETTVRLTAFGADPSDPTHDDAPAYKGAVAELAAQGGGVLELPTGTTTLASELNHSMLLNDAGGNATGVAGFRLRGRGSDRTVVMGHTSLNLNGSNRRQAFENYGLAGMTLDFRHAEQRDGLVNTVERFLVEDVKTLGAPETALVSGTWRDGVWRSCTLDGGDMRYAGLFDVRAERVLFQNVTCRRSSTSGWWHNRSQDVYHVQCRASGCAGSGISGENDPRNITVIGGEYNHNRQRGLHGDGIEVFLAHIHDNDRAASGYRGLATGVAVGCRVTNDDAKVSRFAANNVPPLRLDVRKLLQTEGNYAFHDGSGGNTEGPAVYDGSKWYSLVNGEEIT